MWRRHVCYVCKRSVCGGDEPQPVAHLSHKLQCARQSLKIMVSYGNKYPRHNARPHVVEQSGQCARALMHRIDVLIINAVTYAYFLLECVPFSWLYTIDILCLVHFYFNFCMKKYLDKKRLFRFSKYFFRAQIFAKHKMAIISKVTKNRRIRTKNMHISQGNSDYYFIKCNV